MIPYWKQFVAAVNIVHSKATSVQAGLGAVVGMFLGLLPMSINSVIIILISTFLNLDAGLMVWSTFCFATLSTFLDTFAHHLGFWMLSLPALKPIYTTLYNLPFAPFSNFNNTLVMGNTLLGIIFFFPVYFSGKKFIKMIQTASFQQKIEKFKANKIIMKVSSFLSLFNLKKKWFG